jgi:hypothetical protein
VPARNAKLSAGLMKVSGNVKESGTGSWPSSASVLGSALTWLQPPMLISPADAPLAICGTGTRVWHVPPPLTGTSGRLAVSPAGGTPVVQPNCQFQSS